jgi:hypothetical protein
MSNNPGILGLVGCLLITTAAQLAAAEPPPESVVQNVVLITLDGLRPEEVFSGGDERLMIKELGPEEPEELKSRYWRESAEERRQILLPFLWSMVNANHAWIAGDPHHDSAVRVTNGLYFSYPGYNELLVGHADPAVNSNAKKYNENVTVLEWLNRQAGFHDRVAAYCSWDVFPFIINDRRSGIPVNAGWSKLTVGPQDTLAAVNFIAEQLFREWDGVRYDAFTCTGAIEELRTNKPRVLFVSLGETDDWAHRGRYDRYLLTATQNDFFIKTLWEETQSMPEYAGKTLFLITTDHGRGDGREGWKSHGALLPGSERIWTIAFGAGVKQTGFDRGGAFEQRQIAPTVAAALGFDLKAFNDKVASPLPFLQSPATADRIIQ